MAVWYTQTVDGESSDPQRIAPVDPADTDADLLERKFASAAAHGWTVERNADGSFRATKTRWADNTCIRDFWIE